MKKNILLKDYTSFKIGGRARYFTEAKTKEDLIKAIKAAEGLNLPFFVIGKASNLLISSKGYQGVLILNSIKGVRVSDTIECRSGELLSSLVSTALREELKGMEWAAGIPGTVGGAVRGNAGAFNQSMSESVEKVKAYNAKEDKIEYLSNKECEFSYRESIFKRNTDLIILKAYIKLKKGKRKQIEGKIKEYLDYRIKRQPYQFPSAGSVFKNFEGTITDKKLLEEFEELEQFNKNKVIPAGYLIDKCGLKGTKEGGAQISEKQANFIINFSDATSEDVLKLINLIKKKVKDKFNIELKEEIQYL